MFRNIVGIGFHKRNLEVGADKVLGKSVKSIKLRLFPRFDSGERK